MKFPRATSLVVCFQHKQDAEAFVSALEERLTKFNLEMTEEKTRIIRFGRYADQNSRKDGKGKQDTFNFLGFTHYCGRSKKGKFWGKTQNKPEEAKREF